MGDRSATVGSEAELGGLSSGQEEEAPDDVRCANFNQDFTWVPTCLREATISLCPPTGTRGQCCVSNCVVVQRLYVSSLVAVVSEDHPRKLCLNHFKKNSHICSYTYITSILNVLLNRERLVVVCEDKLSVHVVKDMELVHTITDTPHNPAGLCALANSPTNAHLAYPASTTHGVVQVFHAVALLATASVKGTVVRVFSVLGEAAGEKLWELRRGMTRSVTIHSLAFSGDASLLGASSSSPTVHIFRLAPPPAPP
ncbi:WD repeat domain phosphoinositide-interacting protein 2-like, partial [Hyalella azteca]|uniref:WD repeat domain phosphoinositide-interacting protein 2-like n=1 Tax=Hyalella azteca TaxID=294128 RepID=A0A979FVV7_HYAAZ